MQKRENTTPRSPPLFTKSKNPPKKDALGSLSVVRLQWATCQFWPLWTSTFACYNLLIECKSETLQCATIMKHYKAKKDPIAESDTFSIEHYNLIADLESRQKNMYFLKKWKLFSTLDVPVRSN